MYERCERGEREETYSNRPRMALVLLVVYVDSDGNSKHEDIEGK